jgi:hypothetical protein
VLNLVAIEQELSEKIKSVRMRAPVRRRGGDSTIVYVAVRSILAGTI